VSAILATAVSFSLIGRFKLHKEQNVQVSDTTTADSSADACKKINSNLSFVSFDQVNFSALHLCHEDFRHSRFVLSHCYK
jgi:hypothetical protein